MLEDVPRETCDMAQEIPYVGLLRRELVLEFPDVGEERLQLGIERELRKTDGKGGDVPAIREVVHQDAHRTRKKCLRDGRNSEQRLCNLVSAW